MFRWLREQVGDKDRQSSQKIIVGVVLVNEVGGDVMEDSVGDVR